MLGAGALLIDSAPDLPCQPATGLAYDGAGATKGFGPAEGVADVRVLGGREYKVVLDGRTGKGKERNRGQRGGGIMGCRGCL